MVLAGAAEELGIIGESHHRLLVRIKASQMADSISLEEEWIIVSKNPISPCITLALPYICWTSLQKSITTREARLADTSASLSHSFISRLQSLIPTLSLYRK